MDTYWHFVNDDRTLNHDKTDIVVEPGLTLTMDGNPVLCTRGFHASRRALDALQYAPGAVVCRVTLGGTIVHDTDKSVGTERTVLAVADATRTLYEFAIWCAEQALARLPEHEWDPRSLAALETKRRWLDGKATDDELDAAWDAARAAAGDAARDAAWDAAWDAARAAAWAAAWDAAWDAARAAAWDAAWDAQNEELERRLTALLGSVE